VLNLQTKIQSLKFEMEEQKREHNDVIQRIANSNNINDQCLNCFNNRARMMEALPFE